MGQIPLISSAAAGPLGVLQLPRLWQKLLLGTRGLLHDDWDMCGAGFDQMCLDGIGLDREATIEFVKSHSPSYAEFEAWVKKHATKLDAASISKLNAAIRAYEHGASTRKAILDGAGIHDDGSIRDAVRLNELDDWAAFHASIVG